MPSENSSRDARLVQVCLSSSWGGLEMAAFELARDLKARSIFMRTICPPDSRLHERLVANDLPVTALKAKKYFDLNAVRTIRAQVLEDKATCVVLQQLRDIWHVSPALGGSLKSVPLIGFGHIFLSHGKKDLFHRLLYRRVNKIICLTETQKKNFLTHLPISPEQIAIIPNGVDTKIFATSRRSEEVRKSLGAAPSDILIGLVGRLDGMKGQIETVQAARLLRDRGVNCKIALIGEDTLNTGGTRAKLEKLISDFNLSDRVLLAGFRKDVPDVVASLDILAMPSWAETFGRVLIEAMSAETPVVATAAGGVVDIVDDGVDGLLVPPQNPDKLADAFETLVKSEQTRERLKTAAKNKVAMKYDINTVQKQLDSLLLGETNAKP